MVCDYLSIYELINSNDVVSFDIFDTVLFRVFKKPEDLFKLLIDSNNNVSYKTMRMISQSQLDYFCNIYDIYKNKILSHFDAISEINLEHQLTFENIHIKKIYDYAKAHNKIIILVSDMYLPSNVIKSILNKNVPWLSYDEIYVSCDIKRAKCFEDSELSIYPYLIKKYGKKIVHIGDNFLSDYKMPKYFGLDAYHLQYDVYENLLSVHNTLVKSYDFFQKNQVSDEFNIGYKIAGPIFSTILYNILSKISKNKNILYLLCTRDLTIIYELIKKTYPTIENVKLLFISRNAVDGFKNDNIQKQKFKNYFSSLIGDFKCIEIIDIGYNGSTFIKLNNHVDFLSDFNINKVDYFLCIKRTECDIIENNFIKCLYTTNQLENNVECPFIFNCQFCSKLEFIIKYDMNNHIDNYDDIDKYTTKNNHDILYCEYKKGLHCYLIQFLKYIFDGIGQSKIKINLKSRKYITFMQHMFYLLNCTNLDTTYTDTINGNIINI